MTLDDPAKGNAEPQRRRRYALAVAAANDGLWDWRLGARKMHFSTRWKALLGYRDGDIGTAPAEWFDRVHRDDLARLTGAVMTLLQGQAKRFELECRMQHRDGSERTLLVRARALRDRTGR